MKMKVNLHMHTSDDPEDFVRHSVYEIIDHATKHEFDALALTCHNHCAWKQEYADYAQAKGILLISGVEVSVYEENEKHGAHVLIINATPDADKVRTFSALAEYREKYPEALIMAPHPFFYGKLSLQEKLDTYRHLFDAIEHSWFYSRFFNRNIEAVERAERYRLPLVATSDTHFLNFMHDNYAVVEVSDKSIGGLVAGIRAGGIENYTVHRKLISELLIPQSLFSVRNQIKKLWKKLHPEKVIV